MEKVILDTDRYFSIYMYYFSHGLLLLRSGKTDEHNTCIDVLFRTVTCMEIRTYIHGLRIEESSIDCIGDQSSRPIDILHPEETVYSLKSTDWEGFIVGGRVFIHEDDRKFTAKSALLENELPFHL